MSGTHVVDGVHLLEGAVHDRSGRSEGGEQKTIGGLMDAQAKKKAREVASAAAQMTDDGREFAARFGEFVGVVAAHFAPDDVPTDIANAALAASGALRKFGRSVAAHVDAVSG